MNYINLLLNKLLEKSFIRFLCVGVINTFFGLSIIYSLKWFFGLNDVYSNLIGYICGIILSYTLNSQWTFKHQGAHTQAFLKFIVVVGIAYLINLWIVLTAINTFEINSYIAQAMGIPGYTLTTYLLSKFFVFSQAERA